MDQSRSTIDIPPSLGSGAINDTVDLAAWFTENELSTCPDCGEHTLIPGQPHDPLRLCLTCGIVDAAPMPVPADA